jgi:hypothetical protein
MRLGTLFLATQHFLFVFLLPNREGVIWWLTFLLLLRFKFDLMGLAKCQTNVHLNGGGIMF